VTDGTAMESSVCAGCLNVLDEEEFIQALNQEWHMECFRYIKLLSVNYIHTFDT
jgi:LIM domain.